VALNGGQATVTSTLQTALGAKVSGGGSAVVAAIGTDGASSPTRSTVKVQDVTLQNGGNVPNTIGALAQDGGLVSFASGSGVAMNADNVIGARSTGTGAEVTATDATVAITGNNARGMQADNGGTVTLSGGTVTATGTNTYGVLSTQAGNAALNGATISTTGNGAYGAVVEGSSSTMSLTGTNTVNTNGPTAHAVVALNGGQLTIKSGAVNATMQGADSAALAAIGRDAVSGTASTINTSSAAVASAMDHTIGVLALGGGVANLSGGSVAMSGNTSVGLIATGTGSLISTVQGTTVDTTGSGSYAAAVGNGGTLNIDGSKVTATGPNANALLVVGSSNTATFTNTTLSSALSDTLLVSGGSGTINLVDGTTTTSGTGKNLLHAMADASGNASNAVLNLKNVQLAGDILVDADGSNADVHLVDSILTGKMTNAGAVTLDPSTWVVTGNSDVKTLALTNSVVAFQPVSLQNGYKSLLVRGDYTSANGTVVMNTLLNEGGSLANQFTDRLLINGNASGNTVLRVIPSGSGAFTGLAPPLSNQGISLVQVGGTSSANAFQLEHGYVTVGTPYQYGLYAYGPGSPNGAAETSQKLITGADHWDYRLQNAYVSPVVPPAPDCTVCDGDHGGEAQPNGPVNPGPFPAPDVRPALAPQIPAYLAAPTSLLNASLQDLDSLHRRLGEIRDDQRLDRMHMGEFFARFIGASLDYNSNRTFQGFGFGSKQNYAAAQFGGDVVVVNNDEGTMRVGIVGTLGRLRYVPEAVDGPSQGRINDSSLALTATYQRKSGWYLDGIFTGSLYEGHISTTARGTVSPLNGTGYSASIEGGRPFGSMQGWTLEPQAQLIYQHMNFVDQIDADGIRVSPGQHDFGIARVGARLTRTMGEKNLFTPYLKVNWLQGIATGGYETIGNQNFALGVYGSGFQAGAGGTFTLSQLLSVYADGAWQQEVTAGGFKGWVYSAGLRLAF
jgi:outer membrane autotransporter protein